jgi:SAM-dependent methyltransferase
MSDDVSTAGYWNALYLKGDTNWNKGACAPPIVRMLSERIVPTGARIAVIGAGTGHEAIAAAQAGYKVSAIDFAPEACKATAEAAAKAGVTLEVLEEDIFHLPKRRPAHYDAVLEHTCFCAIAIERREEYVTAVAGLLKQGGTLFGLFYAHGREGGPPFDTNEKEVRALFSEHFTILRLRVAPDSFDQRAGKELEAVFTAS